VPMHQDNIAAPRCRCFVVPLAARFVSEQGCWLTAGLEYYAAMRIRVRRADTRPLSRLGIRAFLRRRSITLVVGFEANGEDSAIRGESTDDRSVLQ
jgi:hypothetical protein